MNNIIEDMIKENDRSSFVLVMGNTPFIRVVDFLLENRPFDYSKTEIARNAEVGWSTLHGIWKVLGKNQIVKQTRTVGKSKLYKLNDENPVVRKLIELDARITEMYADRVAGELIPIQIKRRK
jgi:DNA-binding transcriptional ArsR family regulator